MRNETIVCNECESLFFKNASKMEGLCPECAHQLYAFENCKHEFMDGRCTICYWDGSVSEFLKSKENAVIFPLETNRLTLRPIDKADAEDVFHYRSDQVTNKYQGFIPATLKDTIQFINKNSTTWNESDKWFQLVIVLDKKIIGDIGIHFLEDDLEVELGCTVDKSYQKRGFAFEALSRVVKLLFHTEGKKTLKATILGGNIESIKLFEKLGFSLLIMEPKTDEVNGILEDRLTFTKTNLFIKA